MTSVSAASLNGLQSSPGFPQQALAGAEPPRGRVLVFEDETVVALDLQRILREADFRVVGPATSVEEARSLVARARHGLRIDAAVIDLEAAPERAREVADLLREADIPFVLLAGARDHVPGALAHERLVEKPYEAAVLIRAVEEAIAGRNGAVVYPIAAARPSFPRVFPQL
jgi:CheY-like chemotaxis protein